MIKKVSTVLILITAALLVFLSIVFSYSDNNDLYNNSETLLFLGNKNIPPIIYDENGTAKGVVVDIAKALSEKMGTKIEIKAIDWEVAQKKVLAGEANALLQINSNPERELIYDFSDELLKSEFSIFIRSGNTDINTTNDLIGKKVGVEAGGYPFNQLSKYDGINIVIISDWTSAFKMVKSCEIDAIVVDRWIGEYELAQSKVTDIQVIEHPLEISYSRIAVKKGNDRLLNSINDGLQALNEDGTMADILSKWRRKRVVYLTEEYIVSTTLYIFIAVLILVLLISLYWVFKFRKLNKMLELKVEERTQKLNNANKKLKIANEQLTKLSLNDKLTRIPNRRYFDSALQKFWNISKREGYPLTLIMIDIDFFKNYNDTYGHLAGDQCLKKIAHTIKNIIKRPGDFIARFGGEEFAVLLYNTKEDGAIIVAEEIRTGVEKLGIKNKAAGNLLTISLGVATLIPKKEMHPKDLISAADQALYKAKNNGRNQVVSSTSLKEK